MTFAWPRRYGEVLQRADAPALSDEEADLVLDLARVVAHGSERRFAPLAAYLAGRFASDRASAGVPPEQALSEAIRVAEALLAGEQEAPSG